MSESRVLLAMLVTAAFAAGAITVFHADRAEVDPGTLDPAVEHYTAGRSGAYAGIALGLQVVISSVLMPFLFRWLG